MNGNWIKLNRKLKDHWLYKRKDPFTKLEAWIDILMTVNYEDKMVNLCGDQVMCKAGESILSLDSWGMRWRWNKSRVRRFFRALKSDTMIDTITERKTTHLRVINWETYQSKCNNNETITERKTTPTKEVKERKNTCKRKSITREEYDSSLQSFREEKHSEWIAELSLEFPELNILKTLKKLTAFWSTDRGYQLKIKDKTKTINWKSTFVNGFYMDFNQVKKSSAGAL